MPSDLEEFRSCRPWGNNKGPNDLPYLDFVPEFVVLDGDAALSGRWTIHSGKVGLIMYCLICDSQLENFSEYGVPAKVGKCSICGAKARHRSMALFLMKLLPVEARTSKTPVRVLEVGPSKVTVNRVIQSRFIGDSRWTLIDVRRLNYHRQVSPPHEFIQMNLCGMTFPNNSFDLIICNNILPFIFDFSGALNEIYRCMRDSGLGILNSDLTDSDKTISAKELQRMDPDLYNEDYLSENGTEWYFGQDFHEHLSRHKFFPLNWMIHKNDDSALLIENGLTRSAQFNLGFKSQLRADTYSSGILTNSVLYSPQLSADNLD